MIQKTVNIILIIYISLVFAILIGWLIIYYIIFPMPKIMELVPDSTIAYIDITDLDSSLATIQRSEFVDRVARSQLWTSFKSSRLWQGLSQDIADLQNLGLDRETIMRLVGRHSIVSFYVSTVSDQQTFNYLLISELDMFTRLAMASGQIERLISPKYNIAQERYRGIKLITVKTPDRIYTYAFVGRAGFLSSNISLVKKTIDVYKQGSHGVSDTPEFSKLTSVLSVSDISFFINAVKFQESADLLRGYGLNLSSLSLISRINLWAGAVYHENGKFRIDNCFLYRKVSEKYAEPNTDAKIDLPLPNNSLAFVIHKSLKPEYVFNWLERNVNPRFAIIRNGLLPIVHESIGEALLSPNTSEYQILPPLLFFMRVRNKVIAETALNDFKMSLKMQNQQMEFNETLYDGVRINYLSYLPGVPLPVGIGYAFIQNDILILATDMSALKSVIDVLNGKSKSIIEQAQYLKVMNPIGGESGNVVYVKLKELSPVVEQVAKLYLYQSMITGNRKAEKLAVPLADNAFILESWNYLGTVWTSDEDKMNLKIALSNGSPN